MKIKLILEVSEETATRTIDIEDLGFTEAQWNELSDHRKQNEIHSYVIHDIEDQPYWTLKKAEFKGQE